MGEAADGASALQAVATLRRQLVLVDIQLPDIDGFAALSTLSAAFARSSSTCDRVVLVEVAIVVAPDTQRRPARMSGRGASTTSECL